MRPAEINALLKKCVLELNEDGSPTPETALERWPRHAPPPQQLTIQYAMEVYRANFPGLLAFLQGLVQQPGAVQLLRGVQELDFQVSPLWECSQHFLYFCRSRFGVKCLKLASLFGECAAER